MSKARTNRVDIVTGGKGNFSSRRLTNSGLISAYHEYLATEDSESDTD